jgi:hypothetical protein
VTDTMNLITIMKRLQRSGIPATSVQRVYEASQRQAGQPAPARLGEVKLVNVGSGNPAHGK